MDVAQRVLDTNIVLYELGGSLTRSLPVGPYALSIISEMELLSYPSLTDGEQRRIEAFLDSVFVIDLTPEVRAIAIQLRREHRLKLPDAIIAATAVALGVELVTSDVRLSRVPELRSNLVTLDHPSRD